MKSIKSQAEGITIFTSIMILMIIMIVFGVLTIITPKENLDIKVEKATLENARVTLINYLNTPFEKGTMKDLILLWYYDNSNEKKLVDETKKIFFRVYKECYALKLTDQEDKILLGFSRKESKSVWTSQRIPLPDNSGKYILISLNPSNFYTACNQIS